MEERVAVVGLRIKAGADMAELVRQAIAEGVSLQEAGTLHAAGCEGGVALRPGCAYIARATRRSTNLDAWADGIDADWVVLALDAWADGIDAVDAVIE